MTVSCLQGTSQVLDLVAYDGYKFVGVIVTLIAGLLNFGTTLYMLVFLYSFLATAFFLVCGFFPSPEMNLTCILG